VSRRKFRGAKRKCGDDRSHPDYKGESNEALIETFMLFHQTCLDSQYQHEKQQFLTSMPFEKTAFCLLQTPSCRWWGDIYRPLWRCSNFSGLVGTLSQLKKQKRLPIRLVRPAFSRVKGMIVFFGHIWLCLQIFGKACLSLDHPAPTITLPMSFLVSSLPATHWQHGMSPPFWELVSP